MIKHPTDKDWHRNAVAGKNWRKEGVWDRVGKLQLDFLIKQGLKQEHRLLDVACGCLRAGVHFIKYLSNGNYYGIDKEKDLIKAGLEIELPRYDLQDSKPVLIVNNNFCLDELSDDIKFNFAIAHSLFTHIVPELIELCISRVLPRLVSNGKLFATFHRSSNNKVDLSRPLSGFQSWRKDERHLTQYPLSMFEGIASKIGCSFDYIGPWGHPYNYINRQLMLEFGK